MLFDIQSLNFTYKLLFKQSFVKKRKADDKCRPKFGSERVKLVLLDRNIALNSYAAPNYIYVGLNASTLMLYIDNFNLRLVPNVW